METIKYYVSKQKRHVIPFGRMVLSKWSSVLNNARGEYSSTLIHIIQGVCILPPTMPSGECQIKCQYCKKCLGKFEVAHDQSVRPESFYKFLFEHYKAHILIRSEFEDDDYEPESHNQVCNGLTSIQK